VRTEPEDFNFAFNVYVEDHWETIDVNEDYSKGWAALREVKEQLAAKVGSRGKPRLWRGLRQITDDDTVGEEILSLDWTDQKRTCKIVIADETFKTGVDSAERLLHFIEAGHGLSDLYICDAESGDPIDYQTEFDGGRFTVHQAIQRPIGNRAIWPDEDTLESVIKGTWVEIKKWIEDQVGCEVILRISKEGLIPVFKEVKEDQRYEDVEFWIRPLGEVFRPEYMDWSLFSMIRGPNYRQRKGHEFWLKENRRIDRFCVEWFRDQKISGGEEFWMRLDDLSWSAIRR
jgi:hypothetical protein